MGSSFSVYGRRKDTERYQMIYNQLRGNPMARFKHEVYGYVLDKLHTDMKSLYLYNGYTRVARAVVPAGTHYLELTFLSLHDAKAWDAAEEQLDGVDVEVPWLYRHFAQSWNHIACDSEQKRVYQRIYMK
tara:strand:- start:179 stop:568 length:390 start_codon:yes stop_codon:yes gene_type:complete